MKKSRFLSVAGFTFIELMVVLSIFTFLFAGILSVLTSSDRSFSIGQNKLSEQQEARRAMDEIARLLRQSNPDWIINATSYNVTISDSGKRIDFYQPVFNASGAITNVKKITFKPNPDNSRQLLKKEGMASAGVVANEMEGVNFGGGCSGCALFNCSTVANDCPVVKIELKTKKNAEFTLTSAITLRNYNITLSEGVGIEQPGEGEF